MSQLIWDCVGFLLSVAASVLYSSVSFSPSDCSARPCQVVSGAPGGWQAQMELELLLWARNSDANYLVAEALHFHPLSLPTPTPTLIPSLRLLLSVFTDE